MDLGLKGKIALIAGGARGCGLAIAETLCAEGATVFITTRVEPALSDALDRLRELGAAAGGAVGDMTSAVGAAEIFEAARRTFGEPDILVVNPPSPPRIRNLEDTTDNDFLAAHDRWVMSLVRLARLAAPAMKARQWGRIVALGSYGMKSPHLKDHVYTMNLRVATAGVIKTMAQEYARHNITANVIAAGPFRTELALGYVAESGALDENQLAANTAMGRWGRPEELAAVAAFLCSTQASFLTGETIRVDGNAGASLF
jgi:3-oxoacyl-[acyl-carrier protein] reductase